MIARSQFPRGLRIERLEVRPLVVSNLPQQSFLLALHLLLVRSKTANNESPSEESKLGKPRKFPQGHSQVVSVGQASYANLDFFRLAPDD